MQVQHTPVICPTCGNVITDKFCAHCGEKKIDSHDFSMKHFLEESIEGLTHFDNKILRSIKLLVTKPGLLTKYYFEGNRMRFMKPLQLFIVCNILFFFLLGKANVFALGFYNYITYTPFINFGTRHIVAQKAVDENQLIQLATIFNERMIPQSKIFIILFIPFFAIFFALFFIRQKRYFTEHLVFAIHFFSFLMLYYITYRFLIEIPFSLFTHSKFNPIFDVVGSFASIFLFSCYFGLAAKRFYNISRTKAIVSGILLSGVYTFSIYAYRMFLFYKIIYSIHL